MTSLKELADGTIEHWLDPVYRYILADRLDEMGATEQGMILRVDGYWTRKLISRYDEPCHLIWSTDIGLVVVGTTYYSWCEAPFNCPFYGVLFSRQWWCRSCLAHSELRKYVDVKMEIQTLPTE